MVAEKTDSMSLLLNEAGSFGVRSGFEENDSIRGGVVKLTFVIEIVDEFAVRPVARDVAVVVEAIHLLQCRTSVSFGVGV